MSEKISRAGSIPCGGGLAAEVALRWRHPVAEPQYRAFDGAQDAHPGGEDRRLKLVRSTEVAEYDRVRRQPEFLSAQVGFGNGSANGGEKGVRQVHQLLRAVARHLERHEHRVRNQIVDKIRAAGHAVAQVMRLHRRRPLGHDRQTVRRRVTGGVDRDVGLIVVDSMRGPAGPRARGIPKYVEGLPERAVELALFRGLARRLNRVAAHAESIAVVALDDVLEHEWHAVEPRVRQKVGDPDLLSCAAREDERRRLRRRSLARDLRRLVTRRRKCELVRNRQRQQVGDIRGHRLPG